MGSSGGGGGGGGQWMNTRKTHRTVLAPGGGEEEKAAAAKAWLEKTASEAPSSVAELLESGGFYAPLTLWGLKVLHTGGGRTVCAFRVPNYLTDGEGNWSAGAIASTIDNVGATAIVSKLGEMKISVDFNITYFAPAKVEEEVEIEGNVSYSMGKLSSVIVEIRKKGNGQLVAVGRQWMSSTHTSHSKI